MVKWSKKGSTLLVIIVSVAVAGILAAAITTAVVSTQSVAVDNNDAQKAYFTARSAVNATVKLIKDTETQHPETDQINAFINSLTANQGNGEIAGQGKYTVKVANVPDDGSGIPKIKISANGTCNKKSVTVSEMMFESVTSSTETDTKPADGTNPFENLFTVFDSNNHYIQDVDINGSILYYGDLPIYDGGSDGKNVHGNVFATGNISITGSSLAITNLTSMGNITLYQDAKIFTAAAQSIPTLTCSGSLTSERYYSHTINGNAYVKGNINLYNTLITGNIQCEGSVTLHNCTVKGSISCKGTANIDRYSNVGTVHQNSSVDIGEVKVTQWAESGEDIAFPDSSVDVTPTAGIVTNSGVLSSNSFRNTGTITVDTGTTKDRNKDIYLIVKSNLTLNNQKILLKGVNHLLICLENGATLTLQGYSEIGMTNENNISRVIILGNENEQLLMGSDPEYGSIGCYSLIRATVFLPKGRFAGYLEYDNDPLNYSNERFKGSIITNTILFAFEPKSNLRWYYYWDYDNIKNLALVYSKVDIADTVLYDHYLTKTTKDLKTYLWDVVPNSWGNK